MSAMSQLLTGLGKAARRGIDAWHGSPYRFSQFTDEAIGSGEGAQVRGLGHYTATLRDEAAKYKVPRSTFLLDEQVVNSRNLRDFFDPTFDNLVPLSDVPDEMVARELYERALGPAVRRNTSFGAVELTPEVLDRSYAQAGKYLDNREMSLENMMRDSLDKSRFDENYYMGNSRIASRGTPEDLRMVYGRMRDMLTGRRVAPNPGSLYRLNLDVNPKRLLNYNAPLSRQPKFVQDVIRQRGLLDSDVVAGRGVSAPVDNLDMNLNTGADLIDELEDLMDPEDVRDLLRDSGIEGTKYTPYGGAKKRGHHIVVFDPERIKILEMLAAAGVVGAAEELARLQSQQAQTTNPEQA